MLASCLDRLNIDFYCQLSPPITKKMLIFQWFLYIPNINRVLKLRSIFHSILVPTWLHFPSQNPWKSDPRAMSKHIDFLIDFCIKCLMVLASSWGPIWGYVEHCAALFCPVLTPFSTFSRGIPGDSSSDRAPEWFFHQFSHVLCFVLRLSWCWEWWDGYWIDIHFLQEQRHNIRRSFE